MSLNKVFKQNFGHRYSQFLILPLIFFPQGGVFICHSFILFLDINKLISKKINVCPVTWWYQLPLETAQKKTPHIMNLIPCQGPRRRNTIMHCYQRGVIWLLTKYPWQWEWAQLEVWRIVIKEMLSCATLHLEQIWINIALRGHTHTHTKRKKKSINF